MQQPTDRRSWIRRLLRPGRFDRRIIVDKPDLKGRVEVLKVHSKDVKMDETVDLEADCTGNIRSSWFRSCQYDQ